MEEEENIMLVLKEKMAFLENLHSSLSKSKAPANITTLNIINDLEKILDILNSRSVLAINTVLNLVDEVFIEEFSPLLHLHKLSRDECNSLEISALLKSLREWVTKLRDSIENDSFKERKSLNSGRQKPIFNPDKQKPIYNSEKYYTDRIKELEAQKQELQKQKIELENAVKNQNSNNTTELISNKIQLENAVRQIEIYEKELKDKKQQEDNSKQWEEKIKGTFTEFKAHLEPIKAEQRRLSTLYILYLLLAGVFLSLIIILEVTLFAKLWCLEGLPTWGDYFAALAPLPILAGLLWAFITQINRNQRQLLILANHIHEVNYIEGLLLATNALSPDIYISAQRVNLAIDKLLNKHLDTLSSNAINEDKIITEEKKDVVPIDVLINILKEAKGIISK